MLIFSKFRLNWLKLNNFSDLNSNSPVLLYLFSRDQAKTDFFDIFSQDNNVGNKVKSLGIKCYSRDILTLPSRYIQKFDVTTVPVVIGLLNGTKVGELFNDANEESFLKLSHKLNSLSKPVESELINNLRHNLNYGNLDELRENILFIKNNLVRELEVDETLFKLTSEASITVLDNPRISFDSLKDDLEEVSEIIEKIEDLNKSEEPNGIIPQNYLTELTSLEDKYFKNFNNNFKMLKRFYLIKLEIIKLISVKQFLARNIEESLRASVYGYKLNVKILQKDLCNLEEFESWDGKQVLEGLFSILDPRDPNLLRARAEVENVIGPRLLNEIPKSTKPLGGVTKKRRGFGGRYIWHGPEYRPKKYKPRNLTQYLNDWICVHDSRPPSFN